MPVGKTMLMLKPAGWKGRRVGLRRGDSVSGFRAGSVSALLFSILRRPLLRSLPLVLWSGIVLRPVDDPWFLRPRNRKVLGLLRAEH